MTGSAHPDIDELVTQWNTNRREQAIAAMAGDKALRARIEAEIARLEVTTGRRNLLEQDEVSRRLHRVLKALVASVDALPSTGVT